MNRIPTNKPQLVLGVDRGTTFTDAVLYDGKKIMKAAAVESAKVQTTRSLEKFLAKNFPLAAVRAVAITGGKARPEKILKLPAVRVHEFDAITQGALSLSRNDGKFLVANIGTGTPLLLVERGKWKHLGGTGVGGGTIAGLGKLLLGADPRQIEKLALSGTNALDLAVGDAVGGRIGVVPANATASNFGSLALAAGARGRRIWKGDVAWSLLNLVAEVVARLSVLAARQLRCERVLVTGRVAENAVVGRRLREVGKMFGLKIFVPENAACCAALGAAICALRAGKRF
ncbi:MAG: hypothetical protein WC792_05080 [Candidatus Micrarchaeia archaeon]|jgi:type II pantothenate kinase